MSNQKNETPESAGFVRRYWAVNVNAENERIAAKATEGYLTYLFNKDKEEIEAKGHQLIVFSDGIPVLAGELNEHETCPADDLKIDGYRITPVHAEVCSLSFDSWKSPKYLSLRLETALELKNLSHLYPAIGGVAWPIDADLGDAILGIGKPVSEGHEFGSEAGEVEDEIDVTITEHESLPASIFDVPECIFDISPAKTIETTAAPSPGQETHTGYWIAELSDNWKSHIAENQSAADGFHDMLYLEFMGNDTDPFGNEDDFIFLVDRGLLVLVAIVQEHLASVDDGLSVGCYKIAGTSARIIGTRFNALNDPANIALRSAIADEIDRIALDWPALKGVAWPFNATLGQALLDLATTPEGLPALD